MSEVAKNEIVELNSSKLLFILDRKRKMFNSDIKHTSNLKITLF